MSAETQPKEAKAGSWSIAIFSSREDFGTLSSTIRAAARASKSAETVIDVIVNGNIQLADEVAEWLKSCPRSARSSNSIRAWHIQTPDKAHAWNQYTHDIWGGSELAFFIDGYAQVMPDALELISAGCERMPDVLAGTGVPTSGSSANKATETMLRHGGIHGNLFAIRGTVLTKMREKGFRLPVGIYRTDPTIGAAINFNLDPSANEWDPKRILVVPNATWVFKPGAWWRLKDVIVHLRRKIRQAQGEFENQAVREHLEIRKKPPESLPNLASDFVESWIRDFPDRARSLYLKNPLCLLALRNMRRARKLSGLDRPPQLLGQTKK